MSEKSCSKPQGHTSVRHARTLTAHNTLQAQERDKRTLTHAHTTTVTHQAVVSVSAALRINAAEREHADAQRAAHT
jgi:hypothetical protein